MAWMVLLEYWLTPVPCWMFPLSRDKSSPEYASTESAYTLKDIPDGTLNDAGGSANVMLLAVAAVEAVGSGTTEDHEPVVVWVGVEDWTEMLYALTQNHRAHCEATILPTGQPMSSGYWYGTPRMSNTAR
jgi:hypothetical protein